MPFSLRVYWDRPASVGYGTYFPNPAYGMEWYRVEVSATADFANSVGDVTCSVFQIDSVCHFDRRVALVTGLANGRVYYYRVTGGTVVGFGATSTAVESPAIPGAPGAPLAVRVTSNETLRSASLAPSGLFQGNCTNASAGNCSNAYVHVRNFTFTFAFRAPADTGDGTSALAIVYYVQVSRDYFSTVVEAATLTSTYPGGLQQNMQWTSKVYQAGTVCSFRVRAANYFDGLGASGPFSEVLILPAQGCPVFAIWENASSSCLCDEGYYDVAAPAYVPAHGA